MADPIEMLNAMSKGVSMETGIPIVNTLVNRGGIVSMAGYHWPDIVCGNFCSANESVGQRKCHI